MTSKPLNDHEKQMLSFIAGICYGCHGYHIKHGLPSQPASRLVNLHFKEILTRGIVPPADGRTDNRTLASLISSKLIIASGTTKDRRVMLSREGVFMAWSLNGEPASQLRKLYGHAQKQIDKELVTMADGSKAAVYPRAAGFSDCFTALEMLGLISCAWMVNVSNPSQAYYSITTTTTTPSDWPNDNDLPAWCEELKDSFTSGIEEGERLALSPLGHDLKNECQSLKQARISFKDSKTEKQFYTAQGFFSLEGF